MAPATLSANDFARPEDHARVVRMRALAPAAWSDEDLDLVLYRATTTILTPGVVKWVLPEFLQRVTAQGNWGQMSDAEIVRQKLDAADFDNWAIEDRTAILPLIAAYSHSADDNASLNDWLRGRVGQEA